MSRPDNQEWAKTYMNEYLGFKERQVFATVPLPKGTKVLGTTTRLIRYCTEQLHMQLSEMVIHDLELYVRISNDTFK